MPADLDQIRQRGFLEILQHRSAAPDRVPTREENLRYARYACSILSRINPSRDELITNIRCAIYSTNESATEALISYGVIRRILKPADMPFIAEMCLASPVTMCMLNAVHAAVEPRQ